MEHVERTLTSNCRCSPHKVYSIMRPAFTLIELLVVISIIAILAAMLMAAVGLVRNSAQSSVCANQQRQIIMGVVAYAGQYDGVLPSAIPFNDVGGPTPNAQYADYFFAHQVGELLDLPWNFIDQDTPAIQSRLFKCPTQRYFSMPGFKTSYGMCWSGSHPDYNHAAQKYTWLTISRMAGSRAGVLGEIKTDAYGDGQPSQWWWIWNVKRIDSINPVAFRHRDRFNAAYIDGHVEAVSTANFLSTFLLPIP